METKKRTAHGVEVRNMSTGMPEVINKQDKDPNKWEWVHKIIATILGALIVYKILDGFILGK